MSTVNLWMTELLAHDHIAQLQREAAEYRRLPQRADRARPHGAHRLAAAVRLAGFRRGPAAVGCEA